MWTPSALKSEARTLAGEAWRVVEYQHRYSTERLTNSQAEQELLEDILEVSKPPYPPEAEHLNYLLKTPFRYDAPYPHGSRFRRAYTSEGVFYASEKLSTALAETAFYRLLFLSLADAEIIPARPIMHTAFAVDYQTSQGIDLTQPPLVQNREAWANPIHYEASQALAEAARKAGIDAIRYESVRDTERGCNLALLTPRVFCSAKPKTYQTWSSSIKPSEVHFNRPYGESVVFPRSYFEDDGAIIAPS